MTRAAERERCLEELERDRWPAPPAGASRLAVTVHALRRRPVGEPSAEDLRLMIGQDVGLAHLLPLAVELLRDDPMAQGDLYEGDLLSAVLTRKPAAWDELPAARRELGVIVSGLTGLPPGLAQEAERFPAR
ncbi:contact-dependent growth inhibition system immunity protein [Streptomyces sp. NPDC005921]|uniref:contact-dependent growth inhibition system immunity protein n=1 Tax=Streptomyces sp. NPDC005827 TaxID=3157070 RepID=UPI0034041B56